MKKQCERKQGHKKWPPWDPGRKRRYISRNLPSTFSQVYLQLLSRSSSPLPSPSTSFPATVFQPVDPHEHAAAATGKRGNKTTLHPTLTQKWCSVSGLKGTGYPRAQLRVSTHATAPNPKRRGDNIRPRNRMDINESKVLAPAPPTCIPRPGS